METSKVIKGNPKKGEKLPIETELMKTFGVEHQFCFEIEPSIEGY